MHSDKYYNLSDNELLEMVKCGDTAAYNTIYSKYSAVLYIHAYKRIKDKEESKDIIQTVFINLWKRREEVEIHANLFNYLYTSVRNACINHIARLQSKELYIKSIQEFSEREAHSSDYKVRYETYLELIRKEIEALPPKTREIFQLSRFQNLTNKEIASRMNLSEQTIKTTIRNALRMLRRRMSAKHAWLLYFL